ncbi:MAG TPA: hypothetical protein VN408_09225, partial [Actinoplanes sp.]|nr:hypothetical protein [Actinoplanes sp.]
MAAVIWAADIAFTARAGFLVLDRRLSLLELAAAGLVIAASAGAVHTRPATRSPITVPRRFARSLGPYPCGPSPCGS